MRTSGNLAMQSPVDNPYRSEAIGTVSLPLPGANTAAPLLKIEGLDKNYGKTKAVSGLNLQVSQGETVVLMGPSGCGKSTTIRCINRLTEPDGGSVIFEGMNLLSLDDQKMNAVRKQIGFVFQNFNLIQRLSCLDNVALGLVVHGMSIDEARGRALAALEKVGLVGHSAQKPSELSGGQQQRVGIARAIALEPKLMLWDEPTAALDPILVREVLDVMEDLVLLGNTTMVIVTHELIFTKRVANRVVLMDKGQVVEEGAPDKVFISPSSEIGKKYKNILEH